MHACLTISQLDHLGLDKGVGGTQLDHAHPALRRAKRDGA
jgi:hypothetical protein